MKAGLPTPEYKARIRYDYGEARRIEHGLSRDAAAVQFNKELIMMQPAEGDRIATQRSTSVEQDPLPSADA
jgi:hypothetical protein